ncbi:hypothetical protein ACQKNB_11975 [Lysinibacillus xylanilyticus]|uniref:hypothetical protein n=1 Tax=Lysinibacillus xylanilyticus TaxID=582475 RepID=UPI003CFF43E0
MNATNNHQSDNLQLEKIKKALAKYGIYNEEQLNEAIKNMKPLNIGCMVSPVPSNEGNVKNII